MKSICYIVPYFGILPENFQIWLLGCKYNPTIDWIIYTDDKRCFDYPKNVKVQYCSFEEMKKRIQSFYDFEVDLSRPWRLALMKPAYGEIFSDDLKGYDFWGYCDIDLMWGDIRKFYTEEILNNFERIGFQGHSTLFPNNIKLNLQYRTIIPNQINYIDVFSGKLDFSWDESGINMIVLSSLDVFVDVEPVDVDEQPTNANANAAVAIVLIAFFIFLFLRFLVMLEVGRGDSFML